MYTYEFILEYFRLASEATQLELKKSLAKVSIKPDCEAVYKLDLHTGSLVRIDTSVDYEETNYYFLGLPGNYKREFVKQILLIF